MAKFLIGENTYLRPLEKEDLEKGLELYNDPEIRYLSRTDDMPSNRAQMEEMFEKINKNKDEIFLVICLNDDTQIGMVDLHLQPLHRRAKMGISIDKSHWGKGYGTEDTVLALNYLFNTLNMHRVEVWVIEFNERSLHLFEKLGFKKEGVTRDAAFKDGSYHSVINLGILEDEWRYDNQGRKSRP